MISINFSTKRILLCEFNVIILFILLSGKVAGKMFKSINILEHLEESGIDDIREDDNANLYQHGRETYYYENEHYPYDKLRKIVEQTKELLLSSNQEDRKILKFDPKHDETYISKSNKIDFYNSVPRSFNFKQKFKDTENSISHHRRLISKSGLRIAGNLKNCKPIVEIIKPQHLKSLNGKLHIIVNLGDDFVQDVNVTACAKGEIDTECGNNITVPELYIDVCQTSYGVYELFAIPQGEEINISNQIVTKFKLPNGCTCKRKQQ